MPAVRLLRYLDNGVVFVGSSYGDSQLIRLSPQPVPGPPGAPPTFLEVLETFTNLGPIVDFAVVDLERQGQGQVPTLNAALQSAVLLVTDHQTICSDLCCQT